MEGVDREGLTEVNLSKDVNEAGEPIMVGAFRVGIAGPRWECPAVSELQWRPWEAARVGK